VPELAVATAPDRRGTGLGGLLLRELVAAAARAGAPGLSLSVHRDNPALRLYERHGFVRVGQLGESHTMLREPLGAAAD
jgi:ribosomal protein S18 acetylase RimI-like enzyme